MARNRTTERSRRAAHLSARWRLTLWFTVLFAIAGAILLTLNYVLVDRSLRQNPDEVRVAVAQRLGVSPRDVQAAEKGELADADDDRAVFREVQAQIAHEHLEHLLTESAIALGIMTGASLGLGWVIAGRVLRPVRQMTATAKQLSESNLHERIALEGPRDELKELADTFDAMLARLEAAFEAQRRFVADASHELRTPLTIIRAEVDVTLADPDASRDDLRGMAETVREATERSEQLIDSLLVLARSDAVAITAEPVELGTLVLNAHDSLIAEIGRRDLDVDLTLEPAIVEGDRSLLDRLVGNLLENAVRHNVTHGWISVETGMTGRNTTLKVANSGAVISAADTTALFDRFRRADAARTRGTPGFGLGLSIVSAVAGAHGGSVRAEPLEHGGLAVQVDLPAPRQEVVRVRSTSASSSRSSLTTPSATGSPSGR
jgi:signal transduction histidine kinase